MNKKTVYIISGPTASGKSLIAYYLAKRIDGEVVNCDSIQLYKYMDIGSAKPSEKAMSEIRHHLYSIEDPSVNMTVADYSKLAKETIDEQRPRPPSRKPNRRPCSSLEPSVRVTRIMQSHMNSVDVTAQTPMMNAHTA